MLGNQAWRPSSEEEHEGADSKEGCSSHGEETSRGTAGCEIGSSYFESKGRWGSVRSYEHVHLSWGTWSTSDDIHVSFGWVWLLTVTPCVLSSCSWIVGSLPESWHVASNISSSGTQIGVHVGVGTCDWDEGLVSNWHSKHRGWTHIYRISWSSSVGEDWSNVIVQEVRLNLSVFNGESTCWWSGFDIRSTACRINEVSTIASNSWIGDSDCLGALSRGNLVYLLASTCRNVCWAHIFCIYAIYVCRRARPAGTTKELIAFFIRAAVGLWECSS